MRVKLIRDRIEISQGRVRNVNSLPGKHAILLLKMHEEVEEISRAAADPEEYADLIEATRELAYVNGVAWSAVEEARLKKQVEHGGFRRGMVLIVDEPKHDVGLIMRQEFSEW